MFPVKTGPEGWAILVYVFIPGTYVCTPEKKRKRRTKIAKKGKNQNRKIFCVIQIARH